MSWTQEKVVNTINEMQKQAATDASLRASIKADPKAAIEKIADLQIPAGFTINIADLNDAELTIVLPKIKSDELSDNDLEAVAGGKWTDDVVSWTGTAAVDVADDVAANPVKYAIAGSVGMVYGPVVAVDIAVNG